MLAAHLLKSASVASLLTALAVPAAAQHSPEHHDTAATAHTSGSSAHMDMNGEADWKTAAMAKHMAYSRTRPRTPDDSVRAMQIVNELRQAIAKYRDVKLAEEDGYKMFAPQIKNQPQYHFTKAGNAFRNQFGFDPARPTSLLYKKNAAGQFVLVGAMYTASKRTTEEELDQRVPLSVARWHRHVNWCIPARNQKDRWTEAKDGRPVFGPLGVATKDECKAVGGRFIPQAFGWMVHANTFAGNDLSSIWSDDHSMEHDHAMLGDPKVPE
jgi:hypothetical protein